MMKLWHSVNYTRLKNDFPLRPRACPPCLGARAPPAVGAPITVDMDDAPVPYASSLEQAVVKRGSDLASAVKELVDYV